MTWVMDWQRRFYAQPKVWVVTEPDGTLEGVYETKEAAQLAVDWDRRRETLSKARSRLRMREVPVCSLELSAERWK